MLTNNGIVYVDADGQTTEYQALAIICRSGEEMCVIAAKLLTALRRDRIGANILFLEMSAPDDTFILGLVRCQPNGTDKHSGHNILAYMSEQETEALREAEAHAAYQYMCEYGRQVMDLERDGDIQELDESL